MLWPRQLPPQQDSKFAFSTVRGRLCKTWHKRPGPVGYAAFCPSELRGQKGLAFGVLLLLMNGAVLRLPIINLAIGNPVDVMLVQSSEAWLISPIMGILIGLMAPATLRAPPQCGSGGRSIDEGPKPEDRSAALESGR